MRLVWNESLRTGIHDIDLQHQELIEIINELEAANEEEQAAADIDKGIARLFDYVFFHFETEESIIRSRIEGTPHADRHVQEHLQFVGHLEAFKKLSGERQRQALVPLLDYLKHWLLAHVMGTDQELARSIEPGQGNTPPLV